MNKYTTSARKRKAKSSAVKTRKRSASKVKSVAIERSSRDLQEDLLTLLYYNEQEGRSLANTLANTVKPRHVFEGDYLDFAERAVQYWREYDRPPGLHGFDFFNDVLADPKNRKAPTYRGILIAMDEKSHGDRNFNPKFVLDQLGTAIARTLTRSKLIEMGELLRPGDLQGIRKQAEELLEILQSGEAQGQPGEELHWLDKFELTDQETEEISNSNWVYPDLLDEGHVVAIVGPPGGGKTTILFDIACTTARDGHDVIYVHGDTNPAEAKAMRGRALEAGVRYLTPDLKVGMTMITVVEQLRTLVNGDVDLIGQVWFFDTLKKVADMVSKRSLKECLGLMRKLSGRGATVVLLCHTNKYRDVDGNYVFEGTGDLMADVDELIYFEPVKDKDGTLTVSTRASDKVRCILRPITWRVDYPQVTRCDEYVDVGAIVAQERQRELDQAAVEVISEALQDGKKKQFELMAYGREQGLGKPTILAVLRRYTGDLWTATRLPGNNAIEYELDRWREAEQGKREMQELRKTSPVFQKLARMVERQSRNRSTRVRA